MKMLGDVPVDDIDAALERRILGRPPAPWLHKCPECGHPLEEHDENARCHEPGCDCGANPW